MRVYVPHVAAIVSEEANEINFWRSRPARGVCWAGVSPAFIRDLGKEGEKPAFVCSWGRASYVYTRTVGVALYLASRGHFQLQVPITPSRPSAVRKTEDINELNVCVSRPPAC